MKNQITSFHSETGSAGIKFLLIFLGLIVVANAAFNYIPVAYAGANFRQEMDTAVVKGLATSGAMKPLEVVKAHVTRAAAENGIPPEAVIEIKPTNAVITAHVVYSKPVNIVPFGIYDYTYEFNHLAAPTGYLMKQ
ncbi:hypothetical protein BH24ACI3_BH24ACI3_07870 [soil metagenome]